MNNTRICLICEKEFTATVNNQVYCGKECYKESQRRLTKEWYKNNPDAMLKYKYNRNPDRERLKRAKKGNAALADINAKAREAGMTYGQYVSKMGI